MIRIWSYRRLAILAVTAYAVALSIMICNVSVYLAPWSEILSRFGDGNTPVYVDVRSREDLRKIRDVTGDVAALMLYQCTDDDLASLSGEGNVTHVQITSDSVTNDGLKHLRNLPRLESVTLSGSKISRDGLKHFGNLPTFKSMGLSGPNIRTEDLEALIECRELTSIGIFGFKITDKVLDIVARIPKLRGMDFDERDLSVAPSRIVERIPNLKRLTIFSKVSYVGPYRKEISALTENDRLEIMIIN